MFGICNADCGEAWNCNGASNWCVDSADKRSREVGWPSSRGVISGGSGKYHNKAAIEGGSPYTLHTLFLHWNQHGVKKKIYTIRTVLGKLSHEIKYTLDNEDGDLFLKFIYKMML